MTESKAFMRQAKTHQEIAQRRTEQLLVEKIALSQQQAQMLKRSSKKLAAALIVELEHGKWMKDLQEHAKVHAAVARPQLQGHIPRGGGRGILVTSHRACTAQVPSHMSDDYRKMAIKLGLPAEPPLYTIGNPIYLAQRMQKRLLKPKKASAFASKAVG